MAQLSLDEFADRIGEIMPVVSREFFKQGADEFYALKITMPQFVIMEILYKKHEINMTDIAHMLDVSTAAMTGSVDRLVREGYVERLRHLVDRRVVTIKLTEKGLTTTKDMIRRRKEKLMKIFGMISQAEREEYLKILTHIHECLAP